MKDSKSKILIFIIFIFSLISLYLIYRIISSANSKKINEVQENYIAVDSEEAWSKVNEWRSKNNFKPLEKNEKLCVVAKDLANDTDIRKITFKDKYWNYPYKIAQVAIYNADSSEDVLNEWTNTPENLEILKKDWKYSCIACEGNNCAQIFSNLAN